MTSSSADRRDPTLVSIGLPVHNGARFLPRALDSLLAQRVVEIEIVVSDNASTDDTWDIATRYAAQDPRVRVSRTASNIGVEANFARVLQQSTGEYFMWAACDDWWAPDFAASLVAALDAAPEAAVAMSAVERVDESGQVTDVVRFQDRANPSGMSAWTLTMQLAGGRPYHLFIYGIYRRAFLKRAFTGFAPVIAADRLFMCRVAMAARFAYVDEVLHRRTVRGAPIAQRYGDEPIGRRWRESSARWRLTFASGPYLWRSPVLPALRRVWVPVVALRFARASLGHAMARSGWRAPGVPSSRAC